MVVNGKQSPQNHVTSGVPQSSVLGPLLFLIYINDSVLEKFNTGSSVTMYADDFPLYKVINSPDDYMLLQSDVNTLAKWVDTKCKQM